MSGRRLGAVEWLKALYEVLASIRESRREELSPSLSYSAGTVYPDALKVAVKHGVRDTELLESLVEFGALEKLYYDSLVACPKCGSIRLLSRFRCPHCGSVNLRKVSVVAHTACGGINTIEEERASPRCSKCGKPLKEVSVIGRLYQCLSCGARFETPLPAYSCTDCNHAFDYRDARYVSIHKYKVKKENLDSVAKKLLLEIAEEVGRAEGFKVETGVQAKGLSGYYHPVDLAFSSGGETIHLDIIAESPRAMSETLANIAKSPDLQSKHFVLAPKSLESGLRGRASGNVITYSDAHELSEKIKQVFKEVKERKRS